MSEWEEVPGATWADIREGWKFDYAVLRGDDKFVPFHGVISTSNHYEGIVGKEHILLRAFRPVEKPKPTVAFVDCMGGAYPAFLHECSYYDARTGGYIDLAPVTSVICEGIVVPAGDLAGMRHAYRSYGTYNSSFRDMADAFFRKCDELGVFGDE